METLLFAAQAAPPRTESLFEAFARSGPMAKLVLLVLVGFSIASWAVVLRRLTFFRKVSGHTREFRKIFRESRKFSEVGSAAARVATSPLVGLFRAGYAEIEAQVRAGAEGSGEPQRMRLRSLVAVERSLQRASGVEMRSLARGQGLLATTASATPFIGLFGTVWGILVAFRDIGATGSTSIATVAPGISEALINTAAGLAAAIPALIAYNHFAAQVRHQRSEMEDFALEFLNLTERTFSGGAGSGHGDSR
jgi:biopolymer transport protein TolQ